MCVSQSALQFALFTSIQPNRLSIKRDISFSSHHAVFIICIFSYWRFCFLLVFFPHFFCSRLNANYCSYDMDTSSSSIYSAQLLALRSAYLLLFFFFLLFLFISHRLYIKFDCPKVRYVHKNVEVIVKMKIRTQTKKNDFAKESQRIIRYNTHTHTIFIRHCQYTHAQMRIRIVATTTTTSIYTFIEMKFYECPIDINGSSIRSIYLFIYLFVIYMRVSYFIFSFLLFYFCIAIACLFWHFIKHSYRVELSWVELSICEIYKVNIVSNMFFCWFVCSICTLYPSTSNRPKI